MTETKDQLPPHAMEAEQGVLGCVLTNGALINALSEKRVAIEWFYDLRHQRIYAAMLDLHGRRDVPVDLITVRQRLKDAGELEQVGGEQYLNQIEDCEPSPSNLGYYLDILREKFVTRQLLAACVKIGQRAQEHDGRVDALLAEALHEVESLSAVLMEKKESHIKDVLLNKVIPQLEEHYVRGKQKLRGLATGFTYLDKVVRGIRQNFYYVIAARPGDGKTSFAMNLVEHTARTTGPVAVFTLEMTEDSLTTRLLFSVADVDSGAFEQGYATKQDFEKLTVATAKLAAQNIYLDPDPEQTMDMIAAKARRMVKDYGIKLFVLDYLQLLDEDDPRGRQDRVQALRRISKRIVALKNKLNVPWLVLAQMNRNIETSEVKRAPVLSDLKECGAIEQDADVVMFLYPPLKVELEQKMPDGSETTHKDLIAEAMANAGITKRDDWPRRVNAAVAKNRYGPVGTVQMLFQSNRCRFHDWRDWATAKGLLNYGKGDRESANPEAAVDQAALIGEEDVPK
jgi:replicative DNA helicase